MSPACSSSCVPSSRLLPADSVVGWPWSWKTSLSVTSCTFYVASDRVGAGCLRLTVCSGSGSNDCGRAVWTRWCWSSRPPFSEWHRQGFRLFWRWRSRSGRPLVHREVRKLIRGMSSANPLWGSPRIHGELLKLDNVRSRQKYKTTPQQRSRPKARYQKQIVRDLRDRIVARKIR